MTSNFPDPALVNVGDINMAVHVAGSGPPVVLVHGFPELAYSWRHQLPALAAAGYRAIAPDMRGYGSTDKPPAVSDYTIQKLIGDLTGLLDALEIEKALFVGHDWGALTTWQMALLAPERMSGLINLNIPFYKRPPVDPIKFMRWKLGKAFYIVNFQKSAEAEQRFDAEPQRFINYIMRRRKRSGETASARRRKRKPFSLLEMLDQEEPAGEAILTADELEFFSKAFSAGGFTGPINWYRNFTHNWKTTRGVAQIVTVPTLFVGASEEMLVSPKQVEAMRPCVPDLEIFWMEDCGHWTQQEKPAELNAVMLEWMGRRYPVAPR